jgi:hypothetical protein
MRLCHVRVLPGLIKWTEVSANGLPPHRPVPFVHCHRMLGGSKRPRRRRGAVLAVAAAAAGIAMAPPQNAISAPGAFVAPGGSDRNQCTRTAPCAGFNRAYRAARPGQAVVVAPGSYPGQTLLRDPSKSPRSPRVVFRRARKGTVTVAGLRLGSRIGSDDGPRRVTIEGMRLAGPDGRQRTVTAMGNATDVLLRNLDGANFYLNGVRRFTVRGGDWGPCTSTSTSAASNEAVDGCSNSKIDGSPGNHDITIVDAVFHDYRIVAGSGAHFECLIIFGGTDITIRRNRFFNCEFYDIFVQHSSTHRMDGMRIVGNWFHTPWNGRNLRNRPGAVAFSPRGRPFNDVLVRGNSFADTGLHVNEDGDHTPYSGFRVVRNVIDSSQSECYPSVTYLRNVWAGGCHASDRRSLFGYSLAGGRLRPRAGEKRAVSRIFNGLASGRSPGRVARELNRTHARPPSGARWTREHVRRIAADPAYLGRRFGTPGAHPPLVGRRLWRQAQPRRRTSPNG